MKNYHHTAGRIKPKRKQLLCSDDAVPAQGQHTKPCTDCPWARRSLPGWTGSLSAEDWVGEAHGEAKIDCHVFDGAQCAGAAIYRTNVAKRCRDPSILHLPADRDKVFASAAEFIEHHHED